MSKIEVQAGAGENAGSSERNYTRKAAEVEAAELEHIFEGKSVPEERLGLAISGGGIRSASFGLGLLQALVSRDVLKRVDYLSTVSGGGYVGSSLTWFLHLAEKGRLGMAAALRESESDDGSSTAEAQSRSPMNYGLPPLMGTEAGNFPFGAKSLGGRTLWGWRNAPLDFIRQHGRYLTPGEGLNFLSLIALVVRSMGASLFIYGGILTAGMAVLKAIQLFEAPPSSGSLGFLSIFGSWLLALSAASISLLLLGGLAYGIGTRFAKDRVGWRYKARNRSQIASGYVLKAAIAFTLLGLLPLTEKALAGAAGALAGGSTFAGGVLALIQAKSQREGEEQTGAASSLRLLGGAALLLFGLLLGSYELAKTMVGWGALGGGVATLLLGGTAFALGWVSNINYLNLHRMYRDRLMETFLPNFSNVMAGEWGRATEADKANIGDMCQGERRRPYHLINTNLVAVDSKEAKYRGRGGDSFVISPLYCGSDATGWCPSDQYMMKNGRGMTLPTAMAISGAAANPNSGVAGAGPTRTRLISALMSVLNLRLGYWAPNPGESRQGQQRSANFIDPGFPALVGRGLSGRGRMVELSDGGHFENLGLYELIRRRVECIIASDAGCDLNFDFADLANAVERVRVDFGVQIVFEGDCGLRGLLPGSAEENVLAPTGDKWELAARGYAVAKILYPRIPDEDDPENPDKGIPYAEGRLYYVKTTLIDGLTADLYGYKQAHPDFPDETTADQFFDEKQFEAYRELGYRLGRQLLKSPHWKAPA